MDQEIAAAVLPPAAPTFGGVSVTKIVLAVALLVVVVLSLLDLFCVFDLADLC